MTTQPGANLYTQGYGSRPEGVEVPVFSSVPPSSNNVNYPEGKRWVDTSTNAEYVLTSFSTSNGTISANWTILGSAAGNLNTLTGDSGGAISPSAGNITLAGTASQIATTGSGNTITFSLIGPYTPGTYTAHGVLIGEGTSSIAATVAGATGETLMGSTGADPGWTSSPSFGGTVTAGTGITATTGDLTVSSGNATVTGNITASKSSAGTNVTVDATNSDNTNAASNAGVEIASGGSSGGDPYLSFQISGVGASTMTMGLDNSASDIFVISNSTAIGTSNALSLTQAGALTATTSITATLGDITATNGNLVLGTAGNKITIPTGANASIGVSSAMSGTPGAVTVATTACSASSKVIYCRATAGGTLGQVSITAQDGTGFTLTSNANETSTFNWWIIN